MASGKLIVLTGPSGVGKGTLVRSLLVRHPELYLSVSATTRSPREGEIEGKDYYFLNKSAFETMIEQNQLLEWAEYAGNYYGTPRTKVEEKIDQGLIVLLEIEVVGANSIKDSFPDALRIFILPPSLEELEHRLRSRKTDTEEAILRRLERAKEELKVSEEFDQRLVNDDLEIALQELEGAIFSD
ncbi:guanylate kinase [Crocosphaera watsonii WH 8501]|uniref:Guanylate kinase n=6 Tax=Crocosphaera watsonii TaxID=263511 RepID=Q4C9G1_CROWT|nr:MULTISPECIES: guanylate kinase [Crocosphaera]EAM53325.1 Guanylate kinase [Crocosphaera watsonii WH 8501]EHJ14759.1 Guanylate kinase [Crocosphaera watsonii WH 0003]MCH2243212.1 guanylate kinase [Crocosphaera sp.]CCQ50631.1 Guanylate kinase [Crocosphaera watsonii WH 8502]CCQ54881.1 Guanylate kinase [Crocosphaera watsonii WH 0005]